MTRIRCDSRDMSQLAFASSFLRFARDSGLAAIVGPREMMDGIREMGARLAQIAADAHAAEREGVPFAEAVEDVFGYPHLVRFFREIDSFLQTPLPGPLAQWLERYLAAPELPIAEVMRSALVESAASPHVTPARALPRFLLFLGVWMNLRVLYLRHANEMIKQGIMPELLPVLAEDVMREWVGDPIPAGPGFRPYRVLVAAAMGALAKHADELRGALLITQDEIVRAEAEALFAKLEAEDAILLRNAAAEQFGEQRLDVERLRELYPQTLGQKTRAALDKKLQRLRDRFREGGVAAVVARDRRFVDVIFGAPAPALEEI